MEKNGKAASFVVRLVVDILISYGDFGRKKDCRISLNGGSFYTVDSRPVCGKCMGVNSDDEEEDDSK